MSYREEGVIGDTGNGVQSDNVARATLHMVSEAHRRGIFERSVKPVFDRIAGIVLSIVTLPLVMLIVPGIWVTLGSPAIYKQRRVGLHGREFTVFKFRTMSADRRITESPILHTDRRRNHKSADDPRHVPYGRFLRKWSLDEIPQFWNIARGEMSIVGPRPELPQIVARYEDWQHRRHEVRPGLTGLWQITARGDAPMHEATDIDIAYVDNVTFRGDLQILRRTPAAVLGTRQGH